MSNEHTDRIDDGESLRAALTTVIDEAQRNDVRIEGGLTIRTASDESDVEIQIWHVDSE